MPDGRVFPAPEDRDRTGVSKASGNIWTFCDSVTVLSKPAAAAEEAYLQPLFCQQDEKGSIS